MFEIPATRRTLNLGSGPRRIEGAVNLDVTSDTGPDVVHDLDEYPWPFDDDQFDTVVASDVIEHLDDIAAAMGELHRICARGAIVHINVPHFSSDGAYTDPTHRHYFGAFTFDYFSDSHPLTLLQPGAVQESVDADHLQADAVQQGRLAGGQPVSAALRATLGLDFSGVVSGDSARGLEVSDPERDNHAVVSFRR